MRNIKINVASHSDPGYTSIINATNTTTATAPYPKESTMKTCKINWLGTMARATADADGTVRVWDSVAGYYTTCHSLTARQMAYVRRMTR